MTICVIFVGEFAIGLLTYRGFAIKFMIIRFWLSGVRRAPDASAMTRGRSIEFSLITVQENIGLTDWNVSSNMSYRRRYNYFWCLVAILDFYLCTHAERIPKTRKGLAVLKIYT